MNDGRGPWYLITGVILGLVIGVIWGWYIAPVRYTDTEPNTLQEEDKAAFRTLIALAYMYSGDTARAQARIALLQDDNPAEIIAAQAQKANAEGRPELEIQALSRLAMAAAAPPASIPTAIPLTLFPTLTPNPTETPAPTLTIPPSQVVTPTQTASSTMEPETPPANQPTATEQNTRTATPTASPFPTPSPTPTPGGPFILDSRILTCVGPGDQPVLVIRTLDSTGNGVPGVEIILNWPGSEEHIFTGLKPELGLGYADFTMTPNTLYALRLADGSQLIPNLTAEQCDPGTGQPIWGTLEITFIQP